MLSSPNGDPSAPEASQGVTGSSKLRSGAQNSPLILPLDSVSLITCHAKSRSSPFYYVILGTEKNSRWAWPSVPLHLTGSPWLSLQETPSHLLPIPTSIHHVRLPGLALGPRPPPSPSAPPSTSLTASQWPFPTRPPALNSRFSELSGCSRGSMFCDQYFNSSNNTRSTSGTETAPYTTFTAAPGVEGPSVPHTMAHSGKERSLSLRKAGSEERCVSSDVKVLFLSVKNG